MLRGQGAKAWEYPLPPTPKAGRGSFGAREMQSRHLPTLRIWESLLSGGEGVWGDGGGGAPPSLSGGEQ